MQDKKTIGLTAANKKVMRDLLDSNFFYDQMDVAKLAMSVAINNDIQPKESESTETIWNVGSFDSDGEIKGLILAIYPGIETPYRIIESLFNEGFRLIAQKMKEKETFEILDLLEL